MSTIQQLYDIFKIEKLGNKSHSSNMTWLLFPNLPVKHVQEHDDTIILHY